MKGIMKLLMFMLPMLFIIGCGSDDGLTDNKPQLLSAEITEQVSTLLLGICVF